MTSPSTVQVPRRGHRPRLGALSAPWLLIAGALALCGTLLFALAPLEVHADTWIALVAGREVAQSGIPAHETLTIATHGRPWIDQQWLAQLAMYELDRAGGLPLVAFADVALVFGALVGAVLAAVRLGATARSVAWILPAAAFGLGVGLELRTEAYAYPLLVALVYLLARDARRPSAAVWWCVPLLVLWGNLHGSAIVAGGLVVLRGLTLAWERRRSAVRRLRTWTTPLGLILVSPLCLAANPYGLSIASYYRATVFNGQLRKLTAEWQPVTHNVAMAIVWFVLVAIAVWLVVARRRGSTLWERGALLLLAIGAADAVRNVPWFALASLVLLPVWLEAGGGTVAWRTRRAGGGGPAVWRTRRAGALAAGIAALGAVLLLQGAVRTLTASGAGWATSYPAGALRVVGAELAAHPGWHVYGDDAYADWLLWQFPQLRGRVAADGRLELFTARQFDAEVDLVFATGRGWKRAARGCRIVVLDGPSYPRALAGFRREPGARVVYDHAGAVVILRSAAGAQSWR